MSGSPDPRDHRDDDERSRGHERRPERGKQRPPGSIESDRGTGTGWSWWIPLLAVMAYLAFAGPFAGVERVKLTYSEFKRQMDAGRVESVTIRGDEIEGRFSKPWHPESSDGKSEEERQERPTEGHDAFRTVAPPFADEELGPLLMQHEVEVQAESPGRGIWLEIALAFLPFVLILGLLFWAGQALRQRMEGMGGGGGGPFGIGRSRARRYERSRAETRFDDVAGAENAKQDLQQVIDFLRDPDRYRKLGAKLPRGVLLKGPPGTGKTLLARAVAGEAEVPFFSISGSEFIETFVGVGAARVRDMFEEAKKEAPSVIFIDEVDSIGRSRGTGLGGGHDEREQTLNQILSEMDGFSGREAVVVMAATNRPDVLDPALLRPGRFDRKVELELPRRDARRAILKVHTREVPLSRDVDLGEMAAATATFSGADLENLVNEAALLAGRDGVTKVTPEHFERARDVVVLGHPRERLIDEDERRRVAWHEAGHALLAALLPKADALRKVTIMPRGHSLGATEQIPDEDRLSRSRSYFLDRLTVMLGGRCSERVVYDEVSSGAADDLGRATDLARKMVSRFGMSDRLGAASFRHGDDHVFLGKELGQSRDFSEHTAELIDAEIQKILSDCEKRALRILEEHAETLRAIADRLVESETLESDEIETLIEESREVPERMLGEDDGGEKGLSQGLRPGHG